MKRVLITGASGLLGRELTPHLRADGWDVAALKRPDMWAPEKGFIDAGRLEGFDAIIHLAGESIAAGRWTAAKKERIRSSRVDATRLLADAVCRLQSPPNVFISASAIGYYGPRGSETVDESSAPGRSFLSGVCAEWEAAAEPLAKKGIRVVYIRTGIVLTPKGGALGKMLLPFKLGAGGIIGSGNQYMSWIDVDDEVGAILHALKTESVRGPVNATAPHPVTNGEFTKALGAALSRPTLFPMPGFAAKLALGEMAEELLLTGARVVPAQLQKSGYIFKYPQLERSLEHLLKP